MDGYMLRMLMNESPEFQERFREFMESESKQENRRDRRHYEDPKHSFIEGEYPHKRMRRDHFGDMEEMELQKMFDGMERHEKKSMWETIMGSHEDGQSKHFTPSYAKYEVEEMCHTENGNKHKGEKYPMDKADEVHKRYKSILPTETTVADVYVAINCHYHDYAQLYKAWFGDGIDTKIIESAIVFWFKDEEFEGEEKLWKFFHKMK